MAKFRVNGTTVVDIYVELIKTAKSNLNQKNNTLSSLMP